MREQVIQAVEKEKLVAIIRGVAAEKILPLAKALYEGGIRLMEITYSANKKVSDEQTAALIESVATHMQGKMLVGAGTVLTVEQVELTKKAGGAFIISPDAYEDVIKRTRELDMVSMPGALTPTEIQAAHRAGADFVKLFPTSTLGPSYIKAVCAPLSHIKMLAVGGVNDENMPEFFKAGAKGFGIGTNITDKKLIDANDWAGVTALAKRYVDVARTL